MRITLVWGDNLSRIVPDAAMNRERRMPARSRNRTDRRAGGFRPAAKLVQDRVRAAGESRGFAITKLLTRWSEIAGSEIAALARPLRISYRRDAFGATLTLLTTGAAAPIVQMQIPQIRERVNACYGYNAISRIVLTQTAPEGFAEPGEPFTHRDNPAPRAPDATPEPAPEPALAARAAEVAQGVEDDQLRSALEALARNVLTRTTKGKDATDG